MKGEITTRLIDADVPNKALRKMATETRNVERAMSYLAAILTLEDTPTVDAVPVVHGRWIEHEWAEEENGLLVSNYECSVCHSWERAETYYCPNCGAKMDGDAT